MGDLLLLAFRKAIITPTQLNYVLWELSWYLSRSSFLVLVSAVKPKVHLLEHLMYAEAVLEHEHLL